MILLIVFGFIALLFFLGQRWLYRRFWDRNLTASVSFADSELTRGQSSEVIEIVENKKWLPLAMVKVKFQAPRELSFTSGKGSSVTDQYYRNDIFHLKSMERITRRVQFYPKKRGMYEIGSMDLVGADLFLIDQFVTQVPVSTSLLVYPEELECADLARALQTSIGTALTNSPLIEDVFSFRGIREYQPGDPMKTINWRASAKTEDDLLVNVREYVSRRPVLFFLNLMDVHIRHREDEAEDLISAIAYLGRLFFEQGINVSLRCNAVNSLTGGPAFASTEEGEFSDFLTVLAGIDPSKTLPFEHHFNESLFLEEEYSLRCFFSLFPDPEMLELVEKGMNMGAAVALILPSRKEDAEFIGTDLQQFTYYVEE